MFVFLVVTDSPGMFGIKGPCCAILFFGIALANPDNPDQIYCKMDINRPELCPVEEVILNDVVQDSLSYVGELSFIFL